MLLHDCDDRDHDRQPGHVRDRTGVLVKPERLAWVKAELTTVRAALDNLRVAQTIMGHWRSSNGLSYMVLRATDHAIGNLETYQRNLEEEVSS